MRIVAEMYQDRPLRCYEVAQDEDGNLFFREQGLRKWTAIHMGINPDLDIYLGRCIANFGYEIQRFDT